MNRFLLGTLLAAVSFCTIGYSQTYSTRFEGMESPLSEGGRWTNNGVDWTQIVKKNGLARGTQSGTNTGAWKFNDSYAHLSGFPPDQEAWGEAHIARPNASCNQELEILLRFTSAPHRTTGYECFARCLNSTASYVQIVRWDGPLGGFTYLADKRGTNYGLKDGDILRASIVGNVITVYINGVEKARATDDTFRTGNPGIGEFLACDRGRGLGSNSDFGFSSFTARGFSGTNGGLVRGQSVSGAGMREAVATTLRGKIMCGYQGWFRCPGDAANLGWIHWSHTAQRIAPETLCFEMWPDMSDYGFQERFAAPGFTYPNGSPAELFSSDKAVTVLRHFEWMRDYGIDGAWVQHFLVDLPGGLQAQRYPSRLRVLSHARAAAQKTGRVWALAYDIAGTPTERVYDVLVNDWKKMVDEGWVADPRYLHEAGRPVAQIWGFYWGNAHNRMTADLANRLIDFFKAPGPYSAFLVGGGSWDWRRVPDAEWQRFYRRFEAYAPWNVGNWTKDAKGEAHASMSWWAKDKQEYERSGGLWMPVVYPGFSWDNLQRRPGGTTLIPRRGGRFLWEQFHELSKLGVDCVYVAMFDEVDEGTAIFKVTSSPPAQGHFVGFEGLPSDWYLRLVGAAAGYLRQKQPIPREIPFPP